MRVFVTRERVPGRTWAHLFVGRCLTEHMHAYALVHTHFCAHAHTFSAIFTDESRLAARRCACAEMIILSHARLVLTLRRSQAHGTV
jgi:hypothetical protein